MDDATSTIDPAVAPRLARILAFGAILLSGALGGVIGWALVRLQRSGPTGYNEGIGALVGATIAALGVAVVATLVMRAMNEWRSIQHGVNPRSGQRLQR